MAEIFPFRAYRYNPAVVEPSKVLTQPYDKITPAMAEKYAAASPYNLIPIEKGKSRPDDTPADNVYTRAAKTLDEWIRSNVIVQDPAPSLYAYFQEYTVPGTSERRVRKGFIAIGRIEDYSAGIVFRHEQTLSGPKKDRLEVLRHTRAHFGQIFMLYPDREGSVDQELDQATRGAPLLDVTDEYGARHRLWAIPDATRIQTLMQPMKLLIADGHHRYETALNYRNEHPDDPAAQYVMMTFVNMYSPGLKILATHRVLRNLQGLDLLSKVTSEWSVKKATSLTELKRELNSAAPQTVRIGIVTASEALLLSRPRKEGELDVPVLHQEILGKWLGIGEDAVREEKYIQYVRGMDAAAAEVRERGAQVAFLLDPTPIDDMARVAFAGGVMPQKSTDFYPKLLTGVTIYRL